MNDDDTHGMFIRQRRNLMGISIIVLFVTYSGLQFNKLNILGNEFTISNPRIINYSLWIAFAYWLMRYFQYMHELGGTRIYMTYEQKLLQLTLPDGRNNVNEKISAKMGGLAYDIHFTAEQWASMPPLFNPVFKRELRFFYNTIIRMGNQESRQTPTEEMTVSLNQGARQEFAAWWRAMNYTAWRTPLVSEYILPPALAFVVVFAAFVHYVIRA